MANAIAILDSFYQAEAAYFAAPDGQEDFGPFGATLSPNILLEEPISVPYGGNFNGLDEFEDWSNIMRGLFSTLAVQDIEYYEREGSNTVVALGTVHVQLAANGETGDFPVAEEFEVDLANGVVSYLRPFNYDTAGVNKVLNFTPPAWAFDTTEL